MTDHDINRVLDRFMGNDEHSPSVARWLDDRNDLAEVLAKLTERQWTFVVNALGDYWFKHKTPNPGHGSVWFFLTCDPRIIATAVAEVVK